ncbi:hypothetical protein B4135_2161 [Caldibacillus debilis]|uniref:Uncharacterized protein n=1 Tax=Caldibacillus debilis TaxID=301148 RepID=A0A150M3R2_9BACI|nr:hypothetical protein B4135_2161 [Caldibacillus debilis]
MSNKKGKTFRIFYWFKGGTSNISIRTFNIWKNLSNIPWECPKFSQIGSSF